MNKQTCIYTITDEMTSRCIITSNFIGICFGWTELDIVNIIILYVGVLLFRSLIFLSQPWMVEGLYKLFESWNNRKYLKSFPDNVDLYNN